MTTLPLLAGAAGLLALSCLPAPAHEFWIDPVARMAEAGGRIRTDLRIGEQFKGDVYPYLSTGFNSFRLAVRGEIYDLRGNEGDLPAIDIAEMPAGLNVISYFGKPNKVTFDDAALFAKYLSLEGLDWVLDAHAARGLPPTGFTEAFSRNVKTLVQSGPVAPEDGDVVVGMPLELVALVNPYADPDSQGLPIALLWDGKPVEGIQVSVYRDVAGTVARTNLRTDVDGRATIPLDGGGRFLVNAVHMRQAPPDLDAAWESHWASLTFALPSE